MESDARTSPGTCETLKRNNAARLRPCHSVHVYIYFFLQYKILQLFKSTENDPKTDVALFQPLKHVETAHGKCRITTDTRFESFVLLLHLR